MSRILIVEDDERIRSSMRLALEDEGYTVEDVASGEEAASRFAEEPAELVLIDLMLPGIDGFETCRTLRRQGTVPIIMVTARSDTHDVVAGLEAGDDVVGVGAGGHHDDGNRALASQGPTGLESVDTREHQVDEHQLCRLLCEAACRLLAAGHILHGVALVLQGQPHRRPDPLVVLDDQDSTHRPIMTRPTLPGRAGRPGRIRSSARSGWARSPRRSTRRPWRRSASSGCRSSRRWAGLRWPKRCGRTRRRGCPSPATC